MNVENLSTLFEVRKLSTEDLDTILELSTNNKIFYQHHPPMATKESILNDMKALPPGKDYNDKYYIGFYKKTALTAVMDLILNYPDDTTCFIGLFMVDSRYQGKGIGSSIIQECLAHLHSLGYKKVRLGTDKNNPQSNAFWRKNGFAAVEESEYILMELCLQISN